MYHSDFLTTPSNYSYYPIPKFLTNSGSRGRILTKSSSFCPLLEQGRKYEFTMGPYFTQIRY